jgi:hypothetical protein
MQQGLNLWLQGDRPAPKPLNHVGLLIYWGHHSSIWMNLLCLSFDWTCITPDVPSRRLQSPQALFMNLVPPSSCIFFNSGPKNALSLSLDVKCDHQTHTKMMPLIMASISRKSSNKVSITIFQMLLVGRRTHKSKAFFLQVQRGFYGFRLWEVKMLWVRIMGVTLVFVHLSWIYSFLPRVLGPLRISVMKRSSLPSPPPPPHPPWISACILCKRACAHGTWTWFVGEMSAQKILPQQV